jgi:hypothetical protein
MGHCAIPELCHLLASVVAGIPSFVSAPFACERSINPRVWIDGIKATGPKADVERYFAILDRTAAECGVTWNSKDSCTAVPQYTWIGVQFDHTTKTVRCKEKLINSIAMSQHPVTIADAESLLGKLRHASAILGNDVGEYYLLLKVMRRRLSWLNRGQCDRSHCINLPPCATTLLNTWVQLVLKNTPRTIVKHNTAAPNLVLYTDSTLEGYGGVLVNSQSGELWVVGATWPTPADNINMAETRALTACLRLFRRHFVRGTTLAVRVDNTSTRAVASRVASGRTASKSYLLNAEGMTLASELRDAGVTLSSIDYINTRVNPADGPSRNARVGLRTGERAEAPSASAVELSAFS